MNKNELKEGEIYMNIRTGFLFKHRLNPSPGYTHRLSNTNIDRIGVKSNFEKNSSHSHYDSLREATPEEKHWLETCIKADKFISYEEAMKSFIPEYVEAISNKHSNSEIIGTIYKTSELPNWVIRHQLNQYWKDYIFHYKPSTKEAYEAQFKTKEVVKVKPFEILETCRKNPNKIKQVINEEGNIFMIGDIITPTITGSPNKGKGFKITGFRLNKDKSMICAITDTHNPYGIGIDKIEHFIEKDEFVLPEKWCILRNNDNYQIINIWCNQNRLTNETFDYIDNIERLIHSKQPNNSWNEYKRFCNIKDNTFTEITFDQFKKYVLKEEDKPKVGDKFQTNDKWNNYFYIITKIIDCENSYCEFKNEDGYNCGTILLKNIKIIK